MRTTCRRPKSPKRDMPTDQDLTDHVNKLPRHEEHWGRQEEESFRGSEIQMLGKMRDGFLQARHGLLDALEMECFPIAPRDIMERIDRCDSMLLCIRHGEADGEAAHFGVDLSPGGTCSTMMASCWPVVSSPSL